ncbi:hypothetical protein HLI_15980 [Halobacillus litoralis]|uniref:Uncharacterized protein n=1 Tax=Halobacillus litoralis TaxID=45668 RepID=A0A410MFT8_9BACI|nr:hypothetical protein HLI_15980 [Halobacillus litoralis]
MARSGGERRDSCGERGQGETPEGTSKATEELHFLELCIKLKNRVGRFYRELGFFQWTRKVSDLLF